MLWRISFFLLLQLAGGGLGWWQGGPWGAALGAAIAAWAWFVWDLLRSVRVLRWLRTGDLASVPSMRGIWGEAADRARRLLRKQEAQIRDSQDRLQEILAALQASPNGVVLLDAQGRIEWCNQMAANHFGFDAQRDVMQSIGNLLRNPEFTAYFAAKDFTSDVVLEGRLSTPSRPVRISVHLHPYGDGRTLLLSRDVTALEQADAMRRDFVANVSHEIRTPLTAVIGYLETLQAGALENPGDAKRFTDIMLKQARRLHRLVEDLMILSRIELGEVVFRFEAVFLPEAMDSVISLLDAKAAAKTIAMQNRLPQNLRPIKADRDRLSQILVNVLDNAVKFTPEGGRITMEAEERGDQVVLKISDTGIGIPVEEVQRLGERFYRVDKARSRELGGTGLGLSIVKHLMLAHGGRMEIESRPGRGTTVSLCFPLNGPVKA